MVLDAKARVIAIGAALSVVVSACAQVRSLPGAPGTAAEAILDAPRSRDRDLLMGVEPAGEFYTCVADGQVVPLSKVTSAGFSAEDILAFAEGVHDMPLYWSERQAVRLEPSSRASRLIVAVERRGQTARFVQQNQTLGHGAVCRSRFEVEVQITLRTEDGALDETFDATLYAKDPTVGFVRARAEGERLRGSLRAFKEVAGTDEPTGFYEVDLAFAESGATGVVAAQWNSAFSSDIYDRRADLAHFGHARCASGNYSVRMAEPVGVRTAEELVESFEQIDAFAIDWMDGQSTFASAVWTAREPGACVSPSDVLGKLALDLYVVGELEVTSEDGRLEGRWPGRVGGQVLATGDDVASVRFGVDPKTMLDPRVVTPAELGFPRISGDGLEAAFLTLYLGRAASGDLEGTFELLGQHQVCAGTSPDPVLDCHLEQAVLERGTARDR